MVGEETKTAPDTAEEPIDAVADTDIADDTDTTAVTVANDGGEDEDTEGDVDYAALAEEDMNTLRAEFPELGAKKSITELKNPLRYAALRDLGLTPREAYLATEGLAPRIDNRRHLVSSVPGGARENTDRLGGSELEAARELFSGLSDRELQKLYKKVIK